jgi:hypothetical protein
MKNALFLFLSAVFAASVAVPQSATNTNTKPGSPSKKKTAAKKKTTSSKKSVTTAARWQPRQLTPTPERYKEIQQALVDKGYLKSEPNGVWDAQSSDALRQFQTDRKLSPTGRISSASLIELGLGPKNDATAKPAEPAPVAPAPVAPTPEN